MAACRVFWTSEESVLLLTVIEEKNILKLIDGKRHRKKEIFKIIEEEFKSRGFADKNPAQLENKWKNLKKEYTAAKKINSRSGEGRATCDFYEILDRLLGARPSASLIPNAIDSSDHVEPVVEGIEEIHDENNEPEAGTSRARQKRTNQATNVLNDVKKMCQGLQSEFLEQQKTLIDYEFKLYAEEENKQLKNLCKETKELFEQSNKSFLEELKKIMQSEKTAENKENESSIVENELSEFILLKK